ncbi:hypothetical protein H0H93_011708 [Arthromyces matolae]|nr:hypothetical protein H0H93_011708 [Arthromyces matolae]
MFRNNTSTGPTTPRSSLLSDFCSSTRSVTPGFFPSCSDVKTQVHILNESRGSTLEVVVSRMKTRGSSVRFVFVSATVPNIQDIASWIGSYRHADIPAKVFQASGFGEEFRPCKLTRHVVGVPRSKGQNDFSFNKMLDYKLFAALQQYSAGKPIMVFCSTRKGVLATAEQLMKDYLEAEQAKKNLPWSHQKRSDQNFHDKRLAELAAVAIGVHHAGLTLDDRRTTESLYSNGTLRVIVATSTLAVGVNLPAHMVVIKGVQTFQNNASVEYSDLEIMQMLGRAHYVRADPSLASMSPLTRGNAHSPTDKDGIALIICETELESKYRALVQGRTILESTLHTNLAEHLNSEIGLGTVTSISTAKAWLRGSFLFQRIKQNPIHYSLGKDASQSWEERVDELVLKSVQKLQQTQLVEIQDKSHGRLVSTDFGDIMSKLEMLSSSEEYALFDPPNLLSDHAIHRFSEIKLRASEKPALNKLRKHTDIRFEIKKLEKGPDKVFLLIQAVLGGISLSSPEYKSADSQPQLEAFSIFRHATRIARAIVEVGVFKQVGAQVKFGLELLRCLAAKAWEDRPVVLRQLEQIGEKSYASRVIPDLIEFTQQVLAEHGIVSFPHLLKQDALRIETLLNRRSPFGLELLASAREMPQYSLAITELSIRSNKGLDPVEIELSIQCGLEHAHERQPLKSKKQKSYKGNMTVVLTISSDLEIFDYRRISTKSLKESKTFTVTVELSRPSQSVTVLITSETIAGVVVQQFYKPVLASNEFPTRNTRPPTSTDIDLEGLEDDPDFWNMDVGEEVADVVRDLTGSNRRDITAELKPRVHSGRPGVGKSFHSPSQKMESSALLRSLDGQGPTKKMPNGNFDCREGLAEKPKKRISLAKSTQASPLKNQQNRTTTAAYKGPESCRKANKNNALERPDTLHEQSSTASNLRLSPGLRKKRKPMPGFKLDYTELNDGRNTELLQCPDQLDEDDLPETIGITPTSNSSVMHSDSYSNSDIDSLIRTLPLDEDTTKEVSDSEDLRKKRKRVLELNPANKRTRFERDETVESLDDDTLFQRKVAFSFPDLELDKPLFLPTSKAQEFLLSPTSYDEISLDLTLERPATPDLSLSTSASNTIEFLDDPGNNADEFAELDAWLNSGAIEIV